MKCHMTTPRGFRHGREDWTRSSNLRSDSMSADNRRLLRWVGLGILATSIGAVAAPAGAAITITSSLRETLLTGSRYVTMTELPPFNSLHSTTLQAAFDDYQTVNIYGYLPTHATQYSQVGPTAITGTLTAFVPLINPGGLPSQTLVHT